MALPQVGSGAYRAQGLASPSDPSLRRSTPQVFAMNGQLSEVSEGDEADGRRAHATTAQPVQIESDVPLFDVGRPYAEPNPGMRRQPPGLSTWTGGLTSGEESTDGDLPRWVESHGDGRGKGLRPEEAEEWACLACGSKKAVQLSDNQWECARCHQHQFYHVHRPTKQQVTSGTWMYVPYVNHEQHDPPESFPGGTPEVGKRRRRRRRHARGGQPSDPSEEPAEWEEEQAESETPTMDPSVTPSISWPHQFPEPADQPPTASPHPHRALRHPSTGTPSATASPEDRLVRALKKVLQPDEPTEWDSMKGPRKGIKFRGGSPPQPPQWRFQPSDVRAYDKYERRVRLWEMQVKHYMSSAEAGLALYASLQGEAEAQLEFLDTSKVYHRDGIQFILDQLKAAFKQKDVYVKRHYLHEYEGLGRHHQESMRNYINRYKRTESALRTIGIDMSQAYDNEARGSRLLDRAKLTSEQQRMILVGTGQNLEFNTVASALVLQFPDYRPPPPIALREFFNGSKGGGKNYKGQTTSTSSCMTSSSSTTASSHGGHHYGAKDGKSRSKGKPSRVFQAITEDPAEDAEHQDHQDGFDDDHGYFDEAGPEEDAERDEDEGPDGQSDVDEFAELAQVLTVTAKKLASMTQGRRFRNAPRKSIEQRKQESPCSACGQLGHWAGDDACPVSAKGKDAGAKGRDKGKGKSSKGDTKQVFRVNHYSGLHVDEPEQDEPPLNPFHVWVVLGTLTDVDALHAAHYMVLDTACQRTCCGTKWFAQFKLIADARQLPIKIEPQNEQFLFGAGKPLRSLQLAILPACIGGTPIRLGASILDTEIPLLGSLPLLQKLGLVLDVARKEAKFTHLACTLPLHTVLGHLAIKITDLPEDCASLSMWSHDIHPSTTEPGTITAETTQEHSRMSLSVSPLRHGQDRVHGGSSTTLGNDDQEAHPSPTRSVGPDGGRLPHGHHGQGDLQGASAGGGDELNKTQGESVSKPRGRPQLSATKGEADSQASSNGDHAAVHSRDYPLRERQGKLRQVQSLPRQVEVERRPARLEVGWLLLQVLAAATIALDGGSPSNVAGKIPRGYVMVPPMPSTRRDRRSRPASMTSWAAGHGLTAEALQDHDNLMGTESNMPLSVYELDSGNDL